MGIDYETCWKNSQAKRKTILKIQQPIVRSALYQTPIKDEKSAEETFEKERKYNQCHNALLKV
jgi:hypothetical protein